ncbi:hypothetical protein [Streptomyces roseochromogenus]|uniref:Uncharacterized protein n=1 Tax=Streptomyces roseochromogenus subsp. oscitans DS 12.976 TaxID=1352936 RepID=V6KLR8_STRRC|nr:hypothetical protein [Streptomyces roseochromogenus]EST29934.1 hypothetical protein M878_19465 [Streptomyces roseochromogenus subsp. oscitans DS 12.976]
MSDLKKEADSLHKAASALGKVGQHTTKPVHDFKEAAHDLSALGALGSLLGVKNDIRDGMNTLAKVTAGLNEEWRDETSFMGEVSATFDLLDLLLAAETAAKKS